LKAFENGTKKHDQYDIHSCNSAHCLAGWKAYDDALSSGLTINDWQENSTLSGNRPWLSSENLENFCQSQTPKKIVEDEMDYATEKWGLTESEEDLLFDGDLTLDQMKENLKTIADNHSLVYTY
jgi:hypothetical protein